VVICLLFLMYAFVQKSEADKQKNIALENEQKAVLAQKDAEEKEKEATRQKEIAVAQTKIAESERAKAEAAQAAALEQKSIAEQQRGIAQQNEKLAKASEARANTEKERAEENARIAKINEDKAKAEEQRARELRYRAIAKAIAIKSTQLGDAEQEGLLAQQAFNFNTSFKGYRYDNDIYDGLYWALKKYEDPLTKSLDGHENNIRAMVTRKASKHIYTAGGEGKILRWSYDNNAWKSEDLVGGRENRLITSMDVSPDENWMIVGGNFNSSNPDANFVELYDLRNMSAGAKLIQGFKGEVGDLIFAADSKGFYARDNEGHSVHYCDLNTVKEVITSKDKIRDIALSPDGSKLATAVDNIGKGTLGVWDTKSFTQTSTYENQRAGLYAVNFHPDGNQIMIGDANGLVKIIMGGLVVRELSGHTSTIQVIDMNHGGTFMATASRDKTVRLWNLKNLKEQPIVLKDHPTWVWSIAFTPDDEQILAGTQEQIIRSWPTKVETMSDKLCGKLSRNMTKDEWDIFVSEDLTYESTCENLPANNK
jgi:WD40 repeat protein